MGVSMYKWLLMLLAILPYRQSTGGVSPVNDKHPVYMSVTEIEHNSKAKTLEISCKIFTDDFEKTLRQHYPSATVDLIKPKDKAAMDKLVSDYVPRHLQLTADGKAVTLKYVGYEIIEEGVYGYFQVDNIASLGKLEVTDNVLYEYKDTQISIIHVTAGGDRKSTRLVNPEAKATFSF